MQAHVVTPAGRRVDRALLAAIGSLVLALPSAAFAASAAQGPAAHGQWMLEWRDATQRVQINFTWKRGDGKGHWGGDEIPLARLEGLTSERLDGRPSAARFVIRRDAGTFECEGRAGDGAGAGLYELRLDPTFAEGLRRRGVGSPTEAQQIRLAFADAGFALLDELKARKYETPDIDLLVRMAEHGVDLEYVTGMSELGYRAPTIADLVTLRDHGVDPRYLADMRSFGHGGLSLAEYMELRDHGVDGAYIRGMAEVGHGELPLSTLKKARDHGVDPRYVRGMAELGYKDLALEDLIRARDHGVDARFARRVNDQLGRKASLDRLITIRDQGGID